MEITIGLILIAILFLALAIIWIVKIESPLRASEYRQTERRAMIESIRSIRPVMTSTFIALPDYDADTFDFTWNIQPIAQGAQATPQAQSNGIDQTVHNDAVDLVAASMDVVNPDRKAHQLMTADECQLHGVLGGDRDRRQAAVKYLCDQFDVLAISDQGPKKNGVYYNGGTLRKLITDMAVKSRPRPGSRADYDTAKGNA